MSIRDETHLRNDDQLHALPESAPPTPPRGGGAFLAFGRNIWRQLTSMRVALILLFLLALASLPGALVPQWNLNQAKTATFLINHPTLGPILNRLGFFGVFGSPWYAAIYLALFSSLIGCLIPRTWDFMKALRARPVATPRNLFRLPHQAGVTAADEPEAVAARIESGMRRWRRTRRSEPGGVLTISAEKGFLREVGNLAFHLSLLGLLAAIAVGKMLGFEGTVVVTEGGGFCSGSPSVYDRFRPGLLVDGTRLAPFCVNVDAFTAEYTDAGQATEFNAAIRYSAGAASADATGTAGWTSRNLQVNEPLRIGGERLYLLGHGFTPSFRVTFPNGEVRDASQTFQPSDGNLTSEGAVKFLNPPGYTGAEVRQRQLAIVGIFAPTANSPGGVLTSIAPAPKNPGVAIQIYRGDLGMEDGASQSIFGIDQNQVDTGKLTKLNRANLMVGESMSLDDGTTITFTGFKQWVQLQTSYDPAQGYALVFAIALLAGLMLSLTIKRRRVWYRIKPGADGGSWVEVGGLARTDQAGYGEEFDSLVDLARDQPPRLAKPRSSR